ncbi:MAG TPA: ABC transporter substrate-binding protein [Candidatus Limnocylindria bacterium]|nr:ABC transporter substrate-binding protein [Candidatus Limnocylindria bacterium]
MITRLSALETIVTFRLHPSSLRLYPCLFFATAIFFTLPVVAGSADAVDRIRIAVSNPNMPNLTVAVAQQQGFFKAENIEAEIIRMNPNIAITALSTGDVDYCQLFGGVVGGAIAGLPVRIVAGYLDNWPMTLIAQPELKSLKDLKGKTLGISSFGSSPDVAARMMIKQGGVDPEKEIKVLALGSDAARLTALKQRVVDVVVISPPADTQMERQGYRILARAYELFSFPYLGLGTHMRKIKEKPDEIRRVIKATIRANRFVRDNRDETVRVLMDWGKVDREFAYASYDALRNLFNADGSIPEDGLKLVIEQTRRTNKVAREVAPSEVVDLSFLRQAQAELGIKAR